MAYLPLIYLYALLSLSSFLVENVLGEEKRVKKKMTMLYRIQWHK